ncbi:ferritin-like domain-containing protein [Halomarina halobia]|uniref:Ferritin-like domain-containing protein n=1 Tax=Halomarina halobia TaxID=3033386 RepID=A0ABD6A3T1_9EURY|nr:DUF892 family protein [Halomarina sp. PSR21]
MSADSDALEQLFEEGLQKVYYTEQQLVDALQQMEEEEVSDERVKQAFSEHREETRGHVDRLEEVFESMDASPETKQDRVVDAMIQEHQEFVEQNSDERVLERFDIAAGQKTEHYEIATYGNLTPLAADLGMDDAADRLERNMREEQEALDRLSRISEQFDREQEQQQD